MKSLKLPPVILSIFIFWLSFISPVKPVKGQEQGPAVEARNPAIEYAAGIAEMAWENYAEARKHFAEAARISTDTVLTSRATFLSGWCAYKLSQWAEAADWFSKYLQDDNLLKDYAAYFRAISLTRGADYKKAVPAWKVFFAAYPKTRWRWEARLTQADALQGDGKCSEALPLLRNLLKETSVEDQRARILLKIAGCYETIGKPNEAKRVYLDIYIYRPASGSAPKAVEKLKALGVTPIPLSPAERLTRAEILYDRALWEEAFEEYSNIVASENFNRKDENGRLILVRQAMCLYRLYRTEEAAAAFLKIATESPPGSYTSTGYYYYAHCMGRMEKRDEALAGYMNVIEKTPTSELVPDAWMNVAQIYGESGRWDDVVKCLETVWKKYPQRAAELDIPWRIGWIHYRRGEYAEALDDFRNRDDSQEMTLQRNAYWIARTLEKMGKKDEAVEEYNKLVNAKPYGYYALWAYGRLGKEPLDSVGAQTPQVHTVPNLTVKDDRIDRSRELSQMGMVDFAVEELDEVGKRPDLQRSDRETICLLYRAYGDYYRSRRSLLKLINVDSHLYSENEDRYWRIYYPRPYAAQVIEVASQKGVSPNLAWAIMMQESNFRTRVVSPAGAMGLMQIIPQTARQIAKRLNLPDFRDSDVFDPILNIRMGVNYLADNASNMGDHPGRYYLVVASYNAGPVNARRWARARADIELDEWVEEIPFKETRNYVKRVFSNWSVYQMLYGKGIGEGVPVPVGVKLSDIAPTIMK